MSVVCPRVTVRPTAAALRCPPRLRPQAALQPSTVTAVDIQVQPRDPGLTEFMMPMARNIRPQKCLAHLCGAFVRRPDVFCTKHWGRLPTELQQAIREAIEGDDHGALVELVYVARDALVADDQ